jgi:hypothetical protein
MSPLERLFSLEVEFYRTLRAGALNPLEGASVHTSFALQNGYESLLLAAGRVTAAQVEAMRTKHLLTEDVRDVLAARDSLNRLLGIPVTA